MRQAQIRAVNLKVRSCGPGEPSGATRDPRSWAAVVAAGVPRRPTDGSDAYPGGGKGLTLVGSQ